MINLKLMARPETWEILFASTARVLKLQLARLLRFPRLTLNI